MKKTMLIAGLAAALTVTSAWAQDATYALPTTTVTVQVEIRQDNFFAGPYASFAHRMLNMEAEENDSVTSSLVSARLIPSVEADPSAWYTCDAESAALLSLSAQGLIALTDAGKERLTQWRFLPGLGKDFSRSGLTGPDKPVTRIEYKTVQTDTAEITVPVEHRVLVDKTLEDKAADAADMILNVRRDRLNIASGNTDASYSGEAMGAALRELDRIEKEYLSLFRGYTVSRTYTASFDIRPVAAEKTSRYLVFRLTDQGPVTQGVKGVPYYLELEPEALMIPEDVNDRRKGKGTPVHYRIPAVCKVRLTQDGVTLLETRIPFYQMGKETTLNLTK